MLINVKRIKDASKSKYFPYNFVPFRITFLAERKKSS